jgi:3'-phosphoadenosine 5'-phosphosulfate (PAPS) 3'-phosphatase
MYENEEMGGGKVAISCRRGSKKQEDVIEALGWSGVPCGGSGNKIAMVVRGEVQAMMLIGMPTSTWDSCAGEAIILGMGGFFIRPDLTSISYHPLPHPQLNTKGFICSLTPSLLDQL